MLRVFRVLAFALFSGLLAAVAFCQAPALNLRLGAIDYFGSTINIAARLEGQSSGQDVILSDAVRCDPEVLSWLSDSTNSISVEPMHVSLKGFEQERFAVWRVSQSQDRA